MARDDEVSRHTHGSADDVETFGLDVPASERIKVVRWHLDPDSRPAPLEPRGGPAVDAGMKAE